MNSKLNASLWFRWLIANALGEMVGLGLTFAVGAIAIPRLGNQQSVSVILGAFSIAVVSGCIEASLVGLLQWWAMHRWFSMIKRRTWWLATLIGALAAYILGYLPPKIISLGEEVSQTQTTASEPEQWLVLLLAAALGLVGGAVLSFAQWQVLRHAVRGASIWIPANMLAWFLGMPLIFWGIDASQKLAGLFWAVVFMAGVLFLAGTLVGAIHGAFLVNLAKVQAPPAMERGSIISPS